MISVCVASVRSITIRYLIEAMQRQHFPDWELIIITQGNDAVLLGQVERFQQKDRRILTDNLPGFGKSRALNRAIALAKGDIIAFTDDDCEPAAHWLGTIAECLAREPSVGVIAGSVFLPPGPAPLIATRPEARLIECIYDPAESASGAPPGFWWGGANFAVRRAVIDQVGPFDVYLGPGAPFRSAEDVDFGLRAEACQVPMWTTPRSVVFHTYGRRVGLRAVLKLWRDYALGSGALGGKLELWGHRLVKVWRKRRTRRDWLDGARRNPVGTVRALYQQRYVEQGRREYLANFELGPDRLSRPKRPTA